MSPRPTAAWRPINEWLFSRAVLPVCILAWTILAFREGVGVSDRDAVPDAHVLTQLYYALGLFALGGMDLGTPQGGPAFWRGVLWTMFFLAPTVAAVTVLEGIWRSMRPWITTRWPWRRHVVVAGAGRVAAACVDALATRLPRTEILVVELYEDDSHWTRLQAKPNVYMIRGDITDPALLSQLRLHRARAMLLLTDDEFANIEVASRIRGGEVHDGATTLPLLVRVSNLTLLEAARSLMTEATAMVNLHQGVATNFHAICARHMRETPGGDTLVLAGFGRFSRTFLRRFLTDQSSREIHHLHIVERDPELCWAQFADSLDGTLRAQLEAKLTLHPGDIGDPRLWSAVLAGGTEDSGEAPAPRNLSIALATSDYALNLQTALVLRARLPEAFLAVRTFEHSAFAAQVARSRDIVVVYAADELEDRIHHHWFPQIGL